jgi:hypothetical protein
MRVSLWHGKWPFVTHWPVTPSILHFHYFGAFYSHACQSLFMLAEGVWAEVKIGGEHIHLYAEHNAQGVQFSVYNVNTKSWIAPSEFVRDIEEGKDRAAALAEAYLHRTLNVELPTLAWKKARSV